MDITKPSKGLPVKGFKYRIYVNQAQADHLTKLFGCCRYVYNNLLGKVQAAYSDFKAKATTTKPVISANTLSAMLTELKRTPDHIWLNEVSSVALQQTTRHLDQAYQTFFKLKKGFPRFKSKRNKQSATFTTSGFSIEGDMLKIARLDQPIKLKLSRPLPSAPTSCTISRNQAGQYHISFICQYQPQRSNGTGVIGIDAGITDLVTMSDGTYIPNPRHYVKTQRKLAKAQRKASRAKKGSNNRVKANLRVARIHNRIANQRQDFLHKLSTRLVSENQAIAIESLSIANMVKNGKLAKHILDAAWGKLREQLAYKVCETASAVLFLADPYYPSTQLCHDCGRKPTTKIKLGVTKWTCEYCGTVHQRDNNAAKNLAKLAYSHMRFLKPGNHIVLTQRYQPV